MTRNFRGKLIAYDTELALPLLYIFMVGSNVKA